MFLVANRGPRNSSAVKSEYLVMPYSAVAFFCIFLLTMSSSDSLNEMREMRNWAHIDARWFSKQRNDTHSEYIEPLLILLRCVIGFIVFFCEIPEYFFGQTGWYMHPGHQMLHRDSNYAQHNDKTEQPQAHRALHRRSLVVCRSNSIATDDDCCSIFQNKEIILRRWRSEQNARSQITCKSQATFTSDNNRKIYEFNRSKQKSCAALFISQHQTSNQSLSTQTSRKIFLFSSLFSLVQLTCGRIEHDYNWLLTGAATLGDKQRECAMRVSATHELLLLLFQSERFW